MLKIMVHYVKNIQTKTHQIQFYKNVYKWVEYDNRGEEATIDSNDSYSYIP